MSEKTKKKFAFPRFQPQDIVTILFAVLIFYINFKIVGKCYNPFVYNDEMGYWTHAAEMAGLDWHGVSKTLAWYSFGYSFMLAPLMKIISDTVILYRAAIILNICMEIVSYFLFVYIIRYLFPKIGKASDQLCFGSGNTLYFVSDERRNRFLGNSSAIRDYSDSLYRCEDNSKSDLPQSRLPWNFICVSFYDT